MELVSSEVLIDASTAELEKPKKKPIQLSVIIWAIVLILLMAGITFLIAHKSLNAGLKWDIVLQARSNKSVIDSAMQMATLFNNKNGTWLIGGGSDLHQNTSRPTLYRSADDGITWDPVFVGDEFLFSLYGFQELDNHEIVGLAPGYFLSSNNTGLNWTFSELEGTGMSMSHGNGVLIVSKNPNEVYRSTDNGKTFQVIKYTDKNGDNLRAITYAGNNTFYLGVGSEDTENGTARVFKSTDGGLTWKCVLNLSTSVEDFIVFSVFAYDEDTVIVGTGGGTPRDRVIYHTSNGGLNWTVTANITKEFHENLTIVRSFYKGNDGKLYACLDCSYASSSTWADEPDLNKHSMIIVSKDKGKTWDRFAKTNTKRLYWISQTKDNKFVAATGEYGQILRSR